MNLTNLSVDNFLADKPLAITLPGLEELRAHITARMIAFDAGPHEAIRAVREQRAANAPTRGDIWAMGDTFAAARGQPGRGRPRRGANVGVIQIRGAIAQHEADDLSSFLFGGASTEAIGRQINEFLADPEVDSIVLDIDSPGGTVYGLTSLAALIRDARGQKPIVSIANSMACSAAFWIGSQADQFYAEPDAIVGSIGIYTIHQDISQWAENEGVKTTYIFRGTHKVDGNMWEPLSDEVRARIQARLDEGYSSFVHNVAQGRGISDAEVRDGYGDGDFFTAKEALRMGMIDGIMTLEDAVAKSLTIQPASAEAAAALVSRVDVEDDEETGSNDQVPEPAPDVEGQARLARMRRRSMLATAAAADAV